MLEIAKVLMYVSRFSVAVPFLFILINKKKIGRYFIWLGLLLLISFAADILSMIAIMNHFQYLTAYLTNIQDLLQFLLLLLIYHEFYLKEKKTIVILVTVIYFGFEMVNSIFFQKPNVSQTGSWALSGLIFVGLSVGYFVRMFKGNPMVDITEFAPGWINIAVFVYFGFSLYLFIMAEYVFNNETTETAVIFWGFHNINNILKNCLFAAAIYWGEEARVNN